MEKTGPYNEIKIPETVENLHRPPGSPRPREIKSQKAQLESAHQHGTQKDIKLGMEYKTGLKDKKD
ncbi:MAG: hypothetical protein JL50_03260 [Peptococcaceae bacterium BICA1-7]|nr:MAG: hypothetical protein JL50_03260 [Peptococcaceae bacterium BICA1-7]HBV97716.1 hypothetical protein [Desulfotomaculum sp.]